MVGLELFKRLAFLSPCEEGESSSGSDRACVPSETWESDEESSKLGVLDLEDSPEESCKECCDTALEPQDCALWLNLPLAAVLVLVPSRPEAVVGMAGTGLGDDEGTDSTGAVAPLLVATEVTETRAGEGDEEVVGVGWADAATVGGDPKVPSS